MGLLASTFDVESVVFPMRGSHFLAFYGAGYLILDVGYLILESVVFPRRGSRSMGLERGFGMGLLASTFDVDPAFGSVGPHLPAHSSKERENTKEIPNQI